MKQRPESLSHLLKVTQFINTEARFDPEHSDLQLKFATTKMLFGEEENVSLLLLPVSCGLPHPSLLLVLVPRAVPQSRREQRKHLLIVWSAKRGTSPKTFPINGKAVRISYPAMATDNSWDNCLSR